MRLLIKLHITDSLALWLLEDSLRELNGFRQMAWGKQKTSPLPTMAVMMHRGVMIVMPTKSMTSNQEYPQDSSLALYLQTGCSHDVGLALKHSLAPDTQIRSLGLLTRLKFK